MPARQPRPTPVLVTRLEWEKGQSVFERQTGDLALIPVAADEATLARAVREHAAPAVIVGAVAYCKGLYQSLPPGGMISRFGVGVDNIDLAQATRRRLVVTNTPGVLAASVAEHTIWLLGALARPLMRADAALRQGTWQPQPGREVRGLTLAVIGLGRIGQRVARAAGLGLDMRVVAFGRRPLPAVLASCGLALPEELATLGVMSYTTDLPAALAEAGFVSLHLSLTPETHGFINRERLALMKAGACLINTARGALIDENALYDALASGQVGSAGLDVFTHEPYTPIDPQRDLRSLPNTVLTPHIGSNTAAANERMAAHALANVRAVLDGRLSEAAIVNTGVRL